MIALGFLISSLLGNVDESKAKELLDLSVKGSYAVIVPDLANRHDLIADVSLYKGRFVNDLLRPTKRTHIGELVGIGYDALPYLLTQVKSKEPTEVRVGDGNQLLFLYDSYDPARRDSGKSYWPSVDAVESTIRRSSDPERTLTRGDLATFAVGQITNRWLGILRIHQHVVYYSPVSGSESKVSRLVNEWNGITKQKHKESLEYDVLHPDSYAREAYGFQRFRTFYPDEAADLAIKCLTQFYGRALSNEPSAGDRSIFQEMSKVADERVDKLVYTMLTDGRALKLDRQRPYTTYDMLSYLVDRPGFRDKAIAIAKEKVDRGWDERGRFKSFLERNGGS